MKDNIYEDMKIVSWNVNGLKAVLKNRNASLKEFLDYFNADILCFQETKASRSQIGIETAICEGYTGYFSFCKLKQGYSGVVTFCRSSVTPIAAEEGITGALNSHTDDVIGCPAHLPDLTEEESSALDVEGRSVITEHSVVGGANIVVINVYCPRVDRDVPDRLPYKINFITSIRERCRALIQAGRQVIVCGDMNCTRQVVDSASMQEMPTFPREDESRDLLSTFVGSKATPPNDSCSPTSLNPILLDSFRFLYPDRIDAFTCWCTKTDSRKLNYGQRLDYILLSQSLSDRIREGSVLQDEYGSDHCPVTCELMLELSPSGAVPSLSSTNYPEFAGKQRKMVSYFEKIGSNGATNKRKTSNESCVSKKKAKRDSQPTVMSLWNQKESTQDGRVCPDMNTTGTDSTGTNTSTGTCVPVTKGLSEEWKGVFKAPPKAPLCPGHHEPAVLRTVKKNGPNKHKKFYVCGRPDGAKSDPKSRCDYFQWTK